jgi:hypothetical protein
MTKGLGRHNHHDPSLPTKYSTNHAATAKLNEQSYCDLNTVMIRRQTCVNNDQKEEMVTPVPTLQTYQ